MSNDDIYAMAGQLSDESGVSKLLYCIAALQGIQKGARCGSADWERASSALQPLFAIMARK